MVPHFLVGYVVMITLGSKRRHTIRNNFQHIINRKQRYKPKTSFEYSIFIFNHQIRQIRKVYQIKRKIKEEAVICVEVTIIFFDKVLVI